MKKKRSTQSARDGFCDPVTWMMALHYGCCFGVELTVNNMMASYFYNRFNLNLVTAGAIASCFGLMNLFARALGTTLLFFASHEPFLPSCLTTIYLEYTGKSLEVQHAPYPVIM